jgi:hypothetical protein
MWPLLIIHLLNTRAELDLNPLAIVASIFLCIVLAKALYAIPNYVTKQSALWVLALFSIVVFFKNWHDIGAKNLFFARHENRKPGMLAASAFINDLARPTDKIYSGSPFVYFSLVYYNQTPISPLLYSAAATPEFSGKNLLTTGNIAFDFSAAKSNDTVWLVWSRGFGGGKPNIPGNWEIIAEKYYPDAPDFKGLTVVSEYHVN